ncbi:MAG: o-succinylbenzoate synthase, partial [Synechococcus sp. ELA619]
MNDWLELAWRPFVFRLPRQLVTAHGALAQKRGWLLRLQAADGRLGWGEAAPLEPQDPQGHGVCAPAAALGPRLERRVLEQALPQLPGPLAFALGLALAERDGLGSPAQGGWLAAPPSAELLPAGAAALTALDALLQKRPPSHGTPPFTVKWKVAAGADAEERAVLEQLLARLPAGCKLRLDANGGWDRPTAQAWAERLA